MSTRTALTSATEWLGWRSLDGRVVHAGVSSLMPRPRQWWKIALWLGMIPVVVFLLLAVLVLRILAWLLSLMVKPKLPSSSGFLASVASQFVGFFLTSRLLGQRPMIPVCDYRLRDAKGDEHLVRVEGYVTSGALNVGDDVRVEGRSRRGTLVLRRGWNLRTRTVIQVRIQ